jgi:hypothetical protein
MKKNLAHLKVFAVLYVIALLGLNIQPVAASGPQITSLSQAAQTRSGRIKITGTGFGVSGQVLIGGLPAWTTRWTDTLVVAYVPEAAQVGTVPVQVVSGGVSSNTASLQVTLRQANGRVKWRFQHDAMYALVRPATGPDGSIYAVDVNGTLYSLSPEGALNWLALAAGSKGVTVGQDGTVYTGDENWIKAFTPAGALKWTFVQNPRAFILLGPNVGPDGNIYAVATQGIGVHSLTPDGQLRWSLPETYDRRIVDYQEIVFGPNGSTMQMIFLANNHLRAIKLDGSPVFSNTSTGNQPAAGQDGTIYTTYTMLGAYNPNGSVKWSFAGQPVHNAATGPTVGPDGAIYFAQNLAYLYSVNPNGSQRWLTNTQAILEDPQAVDPTNTQVGLGGRPNYGYSGFFAAYSTASGNLLWQVNLSDEGGGQLVPGSAPRFSADGRTMYINAHILSSATPDYGYIYALDASTSAPKPTPTPIPTPSPTATPPPGGGSSLHVGDLEGSSAAFSPSWRATVTISVHDANHVPVSGVVASGTWSSGYSGPASCTTGSTGSCSITSGNIKNSRASVTFSTNNLSKSGYTYNAAANHDPDGDSNGTRIIVNKP